MSEVECWMYCIEITVQVISGVIQVHFCHKCYCKNNSLWRKSAQRLMQCCSVTIQLGNRREKWCYCCGCMFCTIESANVNWFPKVECKQNIVFEIKRIKINKSFYFTVLARKSLIHLCLRSTFRCWLTFGDYTVTLFSKASLPGNKGAIAPPPQ